MKKLTRRDFMKISAAGASFLALSGYMGPLVSAMEMVLGGKEVSRTTGKFRKAVASTCLNCYARCGIFGYVDQNRVVKIGGNPLHPNNRGRICAKGQAGLNILYDPERLQYPLKRAGARGGGKWQRISWEEAYNELSGKLKELLQKGRPQELVIQSDRDITTQDFVRRFMNAFGSPNALNHTALGGSNKRMAHRITWGVDIDINDVAYTMYILNFGSNPYEAHILRTSFAQRIAEGRTIRMFDHRVYDRAKMVTFDVRCSQTAGRSDEWHSIKPGTDAIVALAMANVIMQENLHDAKFLSSWTNYPAGALANHLKQYSPEIAEKISGVPAADIKRIALEFAAAKPATTISTGGVTKHQNGVYTERCIALLNAITGNVDVKGGYCMPRIYDFKEPAPLPPAPSGKSAFISDPAYPLLSSEIPQRIIPLIEEGKEKVGVYIIYHHDPAYNEPENEKVQKVLKDEKLIPYLVVVDSHMSETALLADIVLPEAIYLERYELESPPAFDMVPLVSLRQPIQPPNPKWEVVPFTEILMELAKRIGSPMSGFFEFNTYEDYIKKQISAIPGLARAGGMDYLKSSGFWQENKKPQYKLYEKGGFNTPSGKFEIYSHTLEKMGFDPLPSYQPIKAHENMKKNELHLTTFQWNVHTHYKTANCKWLSEIVHNNPAWINSRTAAERGISNGDSIRIASSAGSIVTTAWVTEGIHPDVVAVSDNCGHLGYGKTALAQRFDSDDQDTNLLWWGKEGNGVHPNSVIPLAFDPLGGGQGWMDAVVTVEKA